MKKILETLKRKWAEYLLEILVIIFGIIGAFMLDGWRESTKSKDLERVYLEEILGSLKSDREQLKNVITRQQSNQDKIIACIEEITSDTIDYLQLGANFKNALALNPTFFPEDGAYLSLISEGGMNIIRNKSLSSYIANLYEHWYQRLVYNGELIDYRVGNVRFESENYYLHKIEKFVFKDDNNAAMLAHLSYLSDVRLNYLNHTNNTLNAISLTVIAIENELNK